MLKQNVWDSLPTYRSASICCRLRNASEKERPIFKGQGSGLYCFKADLARWGIGWDSAELLANTFGLLGMENQDSKVISLDQLAILIGSQFYLKKKYFPKQRINHVCLFSISFITRAGNLVGFSSQ